MRKASFIAVNLGVFFLTAIALGVISAGIHNGASFYSIDSTSKAYLTSAGCGEVKFKKKNRRWGKG